MSESDQAERCPSCGTCVRENVYWAYLGGPGSPRIYYPQRIMDENSDIAALAFTRCEDPFHPDEVDRLRNLLILSGAWEDPPCCVCGYNGPGYYQAATHRCAAISQEANRREWEAESKKEQA